MSDPRHGSAKLLSIIVLATLSVGTVSAAAAAEPAEVVTAFNAAITERNIDTVLGQLAAGGTQFTLRTAHAGMTGAPTKITGDIVAHWKMVAPLLFAVTSSYDRTPKILDTRVDGELATVWTLTSTKTVENSGTTREESFTELYLLIRSADGWKIGAIADNRGTDDLDVTPVVQK